MDQIHTRIIKPGVRALARACFLNFILVGIALCWFVFAFERLESTSRCPWRIASLTVTVFSFRPWTCITVLCETAYISWSNRCIEKARTLSDIMERVWWRALLWLIFTCFVSLFACSLWFIWILISNRKHHMGLWYVIRHKDCHCNCNQTKKRTKRQTQTQTKTHTHTLTHTFIHTPTQAQRDRRMTPDIP